MAPSEVRSPSPNYFGLTVEASSNLHESALQGRENWSPSTSSVKSFGAAIPKQLPLDANPEFEAFKRQADANRTMAFNLNNSHFSPALPMGPPTARPWPARHPTNHSDTASDISISKASIGKSRDAFRNRMDVDSDSLHDSAYVSSDSKRNSEVSLNAPSFLDMPRHESPVQFESLSPAQPLRRSNLSRVEDARPRLSLPHDTVTNRTESAKPRSETLPVHLEGCPSLIMSSQLSEILQSTPESDYLLIDVRISTYYIQSRIKGALNLCIPTTLLKRATFDLQKLQKTLQTAEDQKKFSQWRHVKHLVVYNETLSDQQDAVIATNMIKKFSNAGYSGKSYILRGGFNAFFASNPALIDRRSTSERASQPASSTDGGRPVFAPVIGGVTLPQAANNPNPFFSNIRQNMDLADGVGQMDVVVPAGLDYTSLPQWLRVTTSAADHGKGVSEKFLKIEQAEQSRMRDAYSSFNPGTTEKPKPDRVALCGIEKGAKNRYKDILPFEHARVHLAGRPEGTCDYINASHIKASRSNKRYIASQGPLPATFDDFWSVVWDQDVRVIVMLTAESEGGQLKCHPYWRDKEFGPIRLKQISEKKASLDMDKHRTGSSTSSSSANSQSEHVRRRASTTTILDSSTPTPQPLQSQSESPHVIIRKFALSHTAHPFAPIREITHLHYPSWPDFGAPAQPAHLLALVELANVMQRAALPVDANAIAASVAYEHPNYVGWYDEPELDPNSRPMLVHCSAGCGRTGTFCTVDSVIDMLKRQRLASIAATKQRDVDGDVDMDAVSPFSVFKDPFARRISDSNTSSGGLLRTSLSRTTGASGLDLSWLGDGSLDLIQKTVEDFRGQRLSMVQSLRQFVLCYETILEWACRMQERSGVNARGRLRSGSLIM